MFCVERERRIRKLMDTLNEGRLKIKKYFDLDTETLVTDLLEKTETDRVP